jgi:hypothetical protein
MPKPTESGTPPEPLNELQSLARSLVRRSAEEAKAREALLPEWDPEEGESFMVGNPHDRSTPTDR